MPTDIRRRPLPEHRIRGRAELVQALPYLLGFHPMASLVLVGTSNGYLVVTVRLDLVDAEAVLRRTIAVMVAGGADEVMAVVADAPPPATMSWRWAGLAAEVARATRVGGGRCGGVLLWAGERWWTFEPSRGTLNPPGGRALPAAPSEFATGATVAGVAPLPDRDALAALLEPLPAVQRAALEPLLAAAQRRVSEAARADRLPRHERALKRRMFAVARACSEPGWRSPSDTQAGEFGVALAETAQRNAVWLAIENNRLDGRPLWRDLARRLPAPYDAPALFLFGWASWRHGDGALANIAAQRALRSDPEYTAADLLDAALATGLDPRRLPRLRLPRPA